MENNSGEKRILSQWHETQKIGEEGDFSFLKLYTPDSYEIKNEVSWLTSTMVRACSTFDVPEVKEASISEGWVKMGYIDVVSEVPSKDITDWLVKSALELHSVIRSVQPHLRSKVSEGEYPQFVDKYVRERLRAVENSTFDFAPEVADWIMKRISRLKTDYFTIVHRDLRARHLLFREEKSNPVLIDWEFSNISDPAQDLAKIIYDATVDRELDRDEVLRYVIDIYANEKKLSAAQIEEKVRTFLPVIPLEHAMSFINRKPEGYEKKVLSDLCFIKALYEEEK